MNSAWPEHTAPPAPRHESTARSLHARSAALWYPFAPAALHAAGAFRQTYTALHTATPRRGAPGFRPTGWKTPAQSREYGAIMRLVPVRILAIDDDESVCRKLSGWLADAAYDVMTFTSAPPALEYARKVYSHVALVDLRLPDTSTVELIETLQQAAPRTRVLGLAAFPEPAEIIAAIRAGARDILEKPLQPASLLAALERHLADMGIAVRSEDEYNRRLGSRVRTVRTAESLTLSEVAGACGLSAAQLSQIELGKTATSTWRLARICAALRIQPAALLDGL